MLVKSGWHLAPVGTLIARQAHDALLKAYDTLLDAGGVEDTGSTLQSEFGLCRVIPRGLIA